MYPLEQSVGGVCWVSLLYFCAVSSTSLAYISTAELGLALELESGAPGVALESGVVAPEPSLEGVAPGAGAAVAGVLESALELSEFMLESGVLESGVTGVVALESGVVVMLVVPGHSRARL